MGAWWYCWCWLRICLCLCDCQCHCQCHYDCLCDCVKRKGSVPAWMGGGIGGAGFGSSCLRWRSSSPLLLLLLLLLHLCRQTLHQLSPTRAFSATTCSGGGRGVRWFGGSRLCTVQPEWGLSSQLASHRWEARLSDQCLSDLGSILDQCQSSFSKMSKQSMCLVLN